MPYEKINNGKRAGFDGRKVNKKHKVKSGDRI
jgi:hypothetical protein